MKEQLIELLEMKDNRMADLERRVFELKAQLAEARGLLKQCHKPVEMMAQNEQYHGSKKKAQKYLDLLARLKKEGGADGEEEGT